MRARRISATSRPGSATTRRIPTAARGHLKRAVRRRMWIARRRVASRFVLHDPSRIGGHVEAAVHGGELIEIYGFELRHGWLPFGVLACSCERGASAATQP